MCISDLLLESGQGAKACALLKLQKNNINYNITPLTTTGDREAVVISISPIRQKKK